MKTIFLDVGAHEGQTLREVVLPFYKFDKIFCFEPMPAQFQILKNLAENFNHVRVLNYGLYDENTSLRVFGDNSDHGATIFKRPDINGAEITNICQFRKASDFFIEDLEPTDKVIMKLNCEGSEIKILKNLIETNEIFKITNVMIDFDILKITKKDDEKKEILDAFRKINFQNYSICEDVMIGKKHGQRIRNWISSLPHNDFVVNEGKTL